MLISLRIAEKISGLLTGARFAAAVSPRRAAADTFGEETAVFPEPRPPTYSVDSI